jgi:hypothetical protein
MDDNDKIMAHLDTTNSLKTSDTDETVANIMSVVLSQTHPDWRTVTSQDIVQEDHNGQAGCRTSQKSRTSNI